MSKKHNCDTFYSRVACTDCGTDMCGDCDEIVRYIRDGKQDPLCGDCYASARTDAGYCARCPERPVGDVGERCLECRIGEAEAMLEAV
jgi:predicted amidophosphoribosyltransferase